MAKRPWFKFFVADWVLATASMTLEEQGAYMRLLALQWAEGAISWEPRRVALKLGVSLEYYQRELEPMVLAHFPLCDDSRRRNPRLERERAEADAQSDANSENGRKGANITNGERRNFAAANGSAKSRPVRDQSQRSESETETETEEEKESTAGKPPPLPFKAEEAVSALATASCGRFTASKLSKGQKINTQRLIREAPALGTWTLVGEWLAAGGDSWKGELDVRDLRDFATWTVRAERWATNGRGPVNAKGTTAKPGNTAPSTFTKGGDLTDEYT